MKPLVRLERPHRRVVRLVQHGLDLFQLVGPAVGEAKALHVLLVLLTLAA